MSPDSMPTREAAEASYYSELSRMKREVERAEQAVIDARNALADFEANKAHFIAYQRAARQ